MSYTYTSLQKALALFLGIPNADPTTPNFAAALPSIIDYAEQRCYNDLDLLAQVLGPVFVNTAAGSRVIDFSTVLQNGLPLLIVEQAKVLSPIPNPSPNTPSQPVTPVSIDFIDAVYNDVTLGTPKHFAMRNALTMILGPTPDQVYQMAFLGKWAYAPLYSAEPDDGTQTTILTTWFPGLFLAAAMISGSGYQKNFGAQADNPQQAQSWENQYQVLLGPAKELAMRQRQHGWQALSSDRNPPPTPQPPPGG